MKNMISSKSRTHTLTLYIFFISIVVIVPCFLLLFQPDYKLKIIKLESGWGYTISNDQGIFIYQENIPVYQGVRSFPSKSTAKKTGKLVLKKLRERKLPVVTKNDLDQILK